MQRMSLGLAIGYENSNYFSTVDGVAATRNDDYYYVEPSVDLKLRDFGPSAHTSCIGRIPARSISLAFMTIKSVVAPRSRSSNARVRQFFIELSHVSKQLLARHDARF